MTRVALGHPWYRDQDAAPIVLSSVLWTAGIALLAVAALRHLRRAT